MGNYARKKEQAQNVSVATASCVSLLIVVSCLVERAFVTSWLRLWRLSFSQFHALAPGRQATTGYSARCCALACQEETGSSSYDHSFAVSIVLAGYLIHAR